jgi:hypothetical protein
MLKAPPAADVDEIRQWSIVEAGVRATSRQLDPWLRPSALVEAALDGFATSLRLAMWN